ncbi:hypothetical protein EBZ80_21570 [bacterium]|nr:hypothetical protein [bacterium]
MENTAPIETSSQSNLEVVPPSSGSEDWASRLDSQIENLNSETSASRYGKVSEKADKAKPSESKSEKSSDAAGVKTVKTEPKSEVVEKTEDKAEKSDAEAAPKEEIPKGLTEKAAVKWGELRAEAAKAKELAKTVESLKAELESVKASPQSSAEVEELRQLNQQYEQELAVARVEATQEYKQNVVQPMVNVVGFLESLATKYELSSRDMLGAFSETDASKQSDLIADLAASMSERDRLRFYSAADDYSEIIARRDYYQNSSQERMAAIEAQRQAEMARVKAESEQTSAAAKAEYEAASEKVFNDLKESVSLLADETIAEQVQKLAKGDYSGADAELKAYMAHSGALLPHVLKALKEAQSELEEANKKIAGYRNSSPKAGSGSSESGRSVPDDVGFLEALEQQLG